MSKKHFIALAAALKACQTTIIRESDGGEFPVEAMRGWRTTVQDVANICAQTNPRFDRARFLKACGLED